MVFGAKPSAPRSTTYANAGITRAILRLPSDGRDAVLPLLDSIRQADPVSLDLPAFAAELLRDGRVARLGTADRSGQPLVLPVCYVFDGRSCFSAIDAKPKRIPRVASARPQHHGEPAACRWSSTAYDEEWTRLAWVIVQGHADILTDGPERAGAVDLLRDKYAAVSRARARPDDRDRHSNLAGAGDVLALGRLGGKGLALFDLEAGLRDSTPDCPAWRIACATRCFSIHARISRSRCAVEEFRVIVISWVTLPWLSWSWKTCALR